MSTASHDAALTIDASPRRRLPAAQRRDQLLAVAVELIRTEGAAALTLARVAEAAGVTKPIAYQHFGTREGLLMTLYHSLDAEYVAQAEAALAAGQAGQQPWPAVVHTLANTFLDCVLSHGPLYTDISVALQAAGGDPAAVRGSAIEAYVQLLRPCLPQAGDDVAARVIAFLGAGEQLASAVLAGWVTRAQATRVLASVLDGLGQVSAGIDPGECAGPAESR